MTGVVVRVVVVVTDTKRCISILISASAYQRSSTTYNERSGGEVVGWAQYLGFGRRLWI